jgi:hypothetical protein
MASARRRDRASRAVRLCATAALTLTVACGGEDSDNENSTSSTTSTAPGTTSPPTTATPTPEEAAKAVYLELVETVDRLLTTDPDPDDADLARLATDPVLGNFRDSLSTMQAENHVVQGGPRTSHRVMSVALHEPGIVVLRDCYVGNDTTIDQDDGRIIGQGLQTRVLEATIVSADGPWRVSAIATIERLDGEVSCPD